MATRNGNVRSFRKQNRRIDYYPDVEAQAEIERLERANPDKSLRQLLDNIVLAGGRAFPEILR